MRSREKRTSKSLCFLVLFSHFSFLFSQHSFILRVLFRFDAFLSSFFAQYIGMQRTISFWKHKRYIQRAVYANRRSIDFDKFIYCILHGAFPMPGPIALHRAHNRQQHGQRSLSPCAQRFITIPNNKTRSNLEWMEVKTQRQCTTATDDRPTREDWEIFICPLISPVCDVSVVHKMWNRDDAGTTTIINNVMKTIRLHILPDFRNYKIERLKENVIIFQTIYLCRPNKWFYFFLPSNFILFFLLGSSLVWSFHSDRLKWFYELCRPCVHCAMPHNDRHPQTTIYFIIIFDESARNQGRTEFNHSLFVIGGGVGSWWCSNVLCVRHICMVSMHGYFANKHISSTQLTCTVAHNPTKYEESGHGWRTFFDSFGTKFNNFSYFYWFCQ